MKNTMITCSVKHQKVSSYQLLCVEPGFKPRFKCSSRLYHSFNQDSNWACCRFKCPYCCCNYFHTNFTLKFRKCDSTSVGVSLMYVPAHMLTAHGSLLATLPVAGMLPDLSTMLSKPIEAMTKTTNIRPKL